VSTLKRVKNIDCNPKLAPDTASNAVGLLLRESFLGPLKITPYRLAKQMGVTQIAVSHILRGRRSITADMALRLGAFFGTSASFWLSLQSRQDLLKAAVKVESHGVNRCEEMKGKTVLVEEYRQDNDDFLSQKVVSIVDELGSKNHPKPI
jgi:addiction module HigA family antidote